MARTALAPLVAGLALGFLASCGDPPADAPQPPESGSVLWTTQFAETGRDFAFALAVGPGDAIAVAGATFGEIGGASNGDRDAFVMVLDGEGRLEWARQFGTPSGDSASAVAFGPVGQVAVGGTVEGALYAGAHRGDGDGFVRIFEADGEVRWTRQFGSTGLDAVAAVAFTADGGVVAAGLVSGALDVGGHEGGFDAFLRRFDADGDVLWTTTFGTSGDDTVGGLAIDPVDGRIVVVGGTTGDLIGPGSLLGERDAFVLVFGDDGDPIDALAVQFGSEEFDTASGVALAPDGSVVVVGYTRGALPGMANAGGFDTFVRAFDDALTEVWTRQAGSPADDFARTVAVGGDGTIAMAGQSFANFGGTNVGDSDAFVRTYGPNGDARWSRLFGTTAHDRGHGVAFVGDDVVVTTGDTAGVLGAEGSGDDDVFVRAFAR